VSRIQRLVALIAVGLLGAVGVTGVMAGPGGVLGGGGSSDDTQVEQSGDVQTPDSLVAQSGGTTDGDTDDVEDVVDEPADDVNDDQGDDVDDADEQEVKGDEIVCPSGENTQFKFETEGNEFEVTGTLASFDGSTVVVTGPDGDVTASVDPGAEIEGDPQAGDPVKVEGAVLDDGSLVAREIEPACEDEDDADDADEDDVDDGDVDDVDDGDSEDVDDDSGHDGSDDDGGSGGGSDDEEDEG
jgi:hypothetical protein